MNDDEIRALIRVAIEKHLGTAADLRTNLRENPREHVRENLLSFGRYPLPRAEDDTQCLIEPAVRCNHCGYCQCHGH